MYMYVCVLVFVGVLHLNGFMSARMIICFLCLFFFTHTKTFRSRPMFYSVYFIRFNCIIFYGMDYVDVKCSSSTKIETKRKWKFVVCDNIWGRDLFWTVHQFLVFHLHMKGFSWNAKKNLFRTILILLSTKCVITVFTYTKQWIK